MALNLWQQCLLSLREQIPQEQFNRWISPLQADLSTSVKDGVVTVFAPNEYVLDVVNQDYKVHINQAVTTLSESNISNVIYLVGNKTKEEEAVLAAAAEQAPPIVKEQTKSFHQSNLNPDYTFESYVVGKSNEIAKAAAERVAEQPGGAYNPLFLYGGVGLGKTHLMHAIGNVIAKRKANAKVIYLHSEQFVGNMVRALRENTIDDFKRRYREVDALLIDDIQFFAGKERSQEEFFHTFNSLAERRQQIIITADRYPKEINGIEERLKSRFGSGLTVAVQPPELETRVAILMTKASQLQIELAEEVAFFIAKRIRSNVRELEGALKRVIANAHFTGRIITIEFVQEALKDVLAIQDKLISMDNIIKTVSEYYKVKVSELLSKKRSRSIARPRQVAMALCKEITNHSLPEIGEAFGGRDHTTVLHACRQIKGLRTTNIAMGEDVANLLQILAT